MSQPGDDFFGLLHEAEAEVNAEQELGLEDPAAVLREQCRMWAEAAGAWRFRDLPRPAPGAPAIDVKNALVEVRARLDSVEIILAQVIATRDACIAQAVDLEQQADDAWDDQAEQERTSRRPRPEYQGSKERYAYWNIAIRAQRNRARAARVQADLLKSTYDQVKLHYDGLNETRRDLASRLTHFRWESHLEY